MKEKQTPKGYEYATANPQEWIINRRFGIHIHKEAQLGKGCKLSRNIVIDKGTVIGERVFIGNNVIIHENVQVGSGAEVLDGAIIYPETVIGENTKILEYTHLGRPPEIAGSITRKLKEFYPPLIIGKECQIGPFARVYRGTVIGDKTSIFDFVTVREECVIGTDVVLAPGVVANYGNKIGDRVRIMPQTHLVATEIEEDVFMGVQVTSYNDSLKEKSADRPWKGPTIKRGAIIGSGSILGAGIEIGEGAFIGTQSVIIRDIPPHAFAAGVPARVKRTINEQQNR